ncbi:MAG: hypothetical protein IH874_00985 [Candidatus Dadabacteria bacterium]|nr:hypothetical protein [Candidatus Dadabacteria bacterium]
MKIAFFLSLLFISLTTYAKGIPDKTDFKEIERSYTFAKANLPENFPHEEILIMDSWIEEYKSQRTINRNVILRKISVQLSFINSLLSEASKKEELARLNKLLDDIEKQIDDLVKTNNKVMEKINNLENQ